MDSPQVQPPGGNAGESLVLPNLCSVGSLLLQVILAVLLALLVQLLKTPLTLFDWQAFSLAVLFCLWAFLGSSALLCQMRPALARWRPEAAALVCLLVVLGVTALLSVLADGVTAGALRDVTAWQVKPEALLTRLLIAAIVTGIALRIFWLSRALRLREQAELQAKLESLQARIRPHFLFNSMNSIASLIATSPARAETAVEDLSGLFRAVLTGNNGLSQWQQERSLCERYLRIEKLRLAERLQVHWDVNAVPADQAIPGLTLQPLLENAIVHGIQERPEGGEVRIEAKALEGRIEIAVSNPLPEFPGSHEGNGLALANIRLRLERLWGDQASLACGEESGRWVARLRLPKGGAGAAEMLR